MDFNNSLNIFSPFEKSIKFQFVTEKIPEFLDAYYASKQKELYHRYSEARMFLRWSLSGNVNDWFMKPENEKQNKYLIELKKRYCCEIALFIYCSMVDICISSCYTIIKNYKTSKTKIISCEDAKKIVEEDERTTIQKLKKLNTETIGLENIKNLCIKLRSDKRVVNLFDDNNALKHRGMPYYVLEEQYVVDKTGRFNIGDKEIPTSSSDIRRHININDIINRLYSFDNNIFFPFLEKYYNEVNNIIKPSKFILL